MPVALFGFLHRLVEPAHLIRVLAGVEADALVLEGAEDVLGPVVEGEVGAVAVEGAVLGEDVAVGGLDGFAGGAEEVRFGAGGVGVGEHAVLDEPHAEVVDLGVDDGAEEGGEVGLKVVH